MLCCQWSLQLKLPYPGAIAVSVLRDRCALWASGSRQHSNHWSRCDHPPPPWPDVFWEGARPISWQWWPVEVPRVPGPSWWTLALQHSRAQAAEGMVLPGPRRLGLGLTRSWHHPVRSKPRAEERKEKEHKASPWSPGSGLKLRGGGVADGCAVCGCET